MPAIVPGPIRTNPLIGSPLAGAADAGIAEVTAPAAPFDSETFAADVERALDERIGVVARSSDAGPARTGRVLPPGVGGAPLVNLSANERLQDRRGVVTRDPVSGTWRFVFQSERTDFGERGIELLPSSVLERIERFVRQSETPPPLLLSGQLTVFEGRNFLLPTSFRTVASGRWITP